MPQLCIAQDPGADELLSRDPLALLIGMLLDQHMRHRSSGRCSQRRIDERLVDFSVSPVHTDERRS